MQGVPSDPIKYAEWVENRSGVKNPMFGKSHSDATRKKMSESSRGKNNPNYGKHHSVETRKKISEKNKGKHHPFYGKRQSDETRKKKSVVQLGKHNSFYGKHHTEQVRNRISENSYGGYWYGAVSYREPQKYCELWCRDLWNRIDAAQNYQSILSGNTKEDQNGRNLDRHHIYWQPKACCEWDDDIGGYYCWIDIGTKKNPNKIKYYINGDPNKFVLLTKKEHGMVRGDKLKWIKIFEDLIYEKLGGICYLPKED